jgi:Major Facilitator Superfamily
VNSEEAGPAPSLVISLFPSQGYPMIQHVRFKGPGDERILKSGDAAAQKKKVFVVAAGILQVMNSTIGSSLPGGAIPYIAHDFHVTDPEGLVLPISLYIVGYVVGPLFFGPLSEAYGRKIPQLVSFIFFNVFTMACALTTSFTSLLVLRLFGGIMASAPIAIVGGVLADIENEPTRRGRVMAYFMAVSNYKSSQLAHTSLALWENFSPFLRIMVSRDCSYIYRPPLLDRLSGHGCRGSSPRSTGGWPSGLDSSSVL